MAPDQSRTGARLTGVDLARGMALLGIMVNHVVGGTPSALLWDLHAVTFTLLVGVGHELGRRSGRPASTAAGAILWRIAVLLAIGLALAALQTRAAIIIANLALVSLVVAVAARGRSRWILLAIAAILLLAPWTAWWVRSRFNPMLPWNLQAQDLAEPAVAVSTVLFATPYPVALWSAYALTGVLVARHVDLTRASALRPAVIAAAACTLTGIAVTAGAVAVGLVRMQPIDALAAGVGMGFVRAQPDWIWLSGAYLPSAPAVLVSGGLAVIGLCLCCAACTVPVIRASAPVWMLSSLGSMTLSGYALHIVVYDQAWLTDATQRLGGAWVEYLVHLVVLSAVLLLWRTGFRGPLAAGPLEVLTRPPGRRSVRAAGNSVHPPGCPRRHQAIRLDSGSRLTR